MPKTYFITNDRLRPEKPSSAYCYIPGDLGNARYKGATNSTSSHSWWQYSTDPGNRDALLKAKSDGDLFTVTEGEIGGAQITIKNTKNDLTYVLKHPQIGLRTVELVPQANNQFTIGHFGHWIENDTAFRPRKDDPIYTLPQEKGLASGAYDNL